MSISRIFNQFFLMLISFFFLFFAGETGAFSIPVLQYFPVHSIAWKSSHYIYEPDSFVPIMQAVSDRPIVMHKTPDWSEREYKLADDPLWTITPEAQPFTKIGYYHCDHLGTPQEITDEEGNIAWSAQYRAWGEAKEVIAKAQTKAGIKNPLRFQGQYFDHETGLHYNRFRYYDPETGRFISRDPIGLAGGLNIHQYAANPVEWVDPFGLAKKSAPGSRKGRNFTRAGKVDVKNENKAKHGGQMTCELCGIPVHDAQQHAAGVAPPPDEAHVDHIEPRSKGGSGTPENGQVLCRGCNLKKGAKAC